MRSKIKGRWTFGVGIWLACVSALTGSGHAQSVDELRDMSINALANLDVTSVTKSSATLADVPASIYVITHDDIVRSGTVTLSGILRLAPNLQIARGSPNDVVITARGMSGNEAAQNFSNKLLVLIDGRTVYSPLYSGVYWDMQDVLPEDIDRIEVISGPGATLWGANAVNGVINIITRNAGASQGLYGTGVVGNRTYDLGLRYGGRLGENGNYRVFLKRHENFETSDEASNGSRRTQAGFRVDWNPSANDSFTVEGDGYVGSQSLGLSPRENIGGADIVARWRRMSASGSTLQVQLYYDYAAREVDGTSGGFGVHTVDADVQHSFSLNNHDIVWGGGARVIRYDIDGVSGLDFVPDKRTLFLANLFAQDSLHLTPRLTAIFGLKLEDPAYIGVQALPSFRLSWKASPQATLWGAVSRAIRSPTPFDRDVVENVGNTVLLTGSADFRSEELTAYEAGTRVVLSSRASLSVSGFYNRYDDLRSIELSPSGSFPLQWGNGMKGQTYGLDAWADIRPLDWWRLKPGYSLLIEDFEFKDGSSGLLGTSQAGNDPKHRAFLRSSMDIGHEINLDADLRYVSPLPDPHVPSYVELGARIGWQFIEQAEISVSGFNLLHEKHQELPATQAGPVSRSVFVALKWAM